jgi:hypothetical protein
VLAIGENNFASGVAVNLLSDIVFAALVALVHWIISKITHGNPRGRRLRLLVSIILWVLANIAYGLLAPRMFSYFLMAGILIFGFVAYRELDQFWRVDLVGVDARIRDGIDFEQSLRLSTTSLEFLGVGASKLTNNRKIFDDAVSRCERPGRAVRLLLSKPDNEGLQRIARKAGMEQNAYQQRVRESLKEIARLKASDKNVIVRFYNDFPAFRLMFINDEICLASHYVLGKGDGSDLPQLQIVKRSSSTEMTSLYFGFHEYFENIWEEAEEWDFRQYL